MLFGTWSQAHAYDPSDYVEARLNPMTPVADEMSKCSGL